MKASYRWLTALLNAHDLSPGELAERFSSAGIAVDGISEYGAGTAAIVVAEVKKIEPHPKRDKLRLVTVDRGAGVLQQVVCGAPNVPDPGGLVCFAPLGTHLPAVGMTLVPRDIGGVTSEGMLCSEREMGLVGETKKDEDHGILILPAGIAAPGTPLRVALPAVHDFVYELDLTPNRPDALGHIGLARDAAALLGLPFEVPRSAPASAVEGEIRSLVEVEIEDTERCPHYGAAMVLDVAIGPSPLWLKYRLESLDVRSISNVVDVTNFVMLEFGHPMHAFDFDLVRGGKILVRRAKEGEKLKTLDGIERTLVADDLVIADGAGPTALAGIMGGEGSEIRKETSRVLLECAYFTTRGVRRSARRHAIHTESSHRFERGVDPADVPDVLERATSLLTQLARGRAVHGMIRAGVPVVKADRILLRSARMDALVGAPVPFDEATKILERLGFTMGTHPEKGSVWVTPPTHRPDIGGEADLIEEVVRVRGLDKIPTVLPAIRPQATRTTGAAEARVRRAALEVGLSEAVVFGFVSPKDIAALGLPPPPITLKNPLGEERSAMRTSLLPGLFDALRRARRRGVADVRLFAQGVKFLEPDPNVVVGAKIEKDLGFPSAALPDEVPSFAVVLAGERAAHLAKPEPIDVYDTKGIALEIVERVTGRTAEVRPQPAETRATFLHPRGAGNVLVDGVVIGCFGPVHPDVADLLDLGGPCFVVELDVRTLARLGYRTPQFSPIPVLPAATRDIALVVHDDVTAGAVRDAIKMAAGELCESVTLFDLFRGGQVAADHQSLAFHVVYRDPKAATDPENARTLTDEDVDKRHQAVTEAVKQQFGAVLRA